MLIEIRYSIRRADGKASGCMTDSAGVLWLSHKRKQNIYNINSKYRHSSLPHIFHCRHDRHVPCLSKHTRWTAAAPLRARKWLYGVISSFPFRFDDQTLWREIRPKDIRRPSASLLCCIISYDTNSLAQSQWFMLKTLKKIIISHMVWSRALIFNIQNCLSLFFGKYADVWNKTVFIHEI